MIVAKKRRALWIAGSLVVLMLALGTVGSMMTPNPEKLHREALAIVRDYGFREVRKRVPVVTWRSGYREYEFYEAKGLAVSEIERIGQRLDAACKGCTGREATDGSGRTKWSSSDTDRLTLTVDVYPNPEKTVVSMDVYSYRKLRATSLWDRIKSGWPW